MSCIFTCSVLPEQMYLLKISQQLILGQDVIVVAAFVVPLPQLSQ